MARRRSSSTDAGFASVEALIVVASLAIFLVAIPFGHGVFAAWYEVQSKTRDRALATASRGCGGGGGGGSEPISGVGASELGEVRRVASERGDPGALAATDTTMSVVTANDSKRVGVGVFSATVRARSFGSCNERPYDTSVQGWSTFGFERQEDAR
jgi:hypothetical protein